MSGLVSGGRLNFAKALANPLLSAPKLNNFPTLTMGQNLFAPAGSRITLTASVSDRDNDQLRMSWARPASTWTQWLFGWVINSIFPNLSGTSVSFTAPSLARTATVPYDASADGRGGSAQGRTYVTVTPASPGLPPSGTLTVSPMDAPAGTTVTVSFPATDPGGLGGLGTMVGNEVRTLARAASRLHRQLPATIEIPMVSLS